MYANAREELIYHNLLLIEESISTKLAQADLQFSSLTFLSSWNYRSVPQTIVAPYPVFEFIIDFTLLQLKPKMFIKNSPKINVIKIPYGNTTLLKNRAGEMAQWVKELPTKTKGFV